MGTSEKIETALQGTHGSVALSVKLLAMEFEEKFAMIEKKIDEIVETQAENHNELLSAIKELQAQNNTRCELIEKRFDKLRVYESIVERPVYAVAAAIGILVIGYILYFMK